MLCRACHPELISVPQTCQVLSCLARPLPLLYPLPRMPSLIHFAWLISTHPTTLSSDIPSYRKPSLTLLQGWGGTSSGFPPRPSLSHHRLVCSGLCLVHPSPDSSGLLPSGYIAICPHWIGRPLKTGWSLLVTTVSSGPRKGPKLSERLLNEGIW